MMVQEPICSTEHRPAGAWKSARPVAICFSKRSAADFAGGGPVLLQPRSPRSGKRVAVVGAGVAGLACARDLALCQRIAKLLRVPAQIADPLTCVQKTGKEPMRHIDLGAPQPGWTVPFGLSFAPRNL